MLSVVILSVVMLSVIILSVVMLSVIILSVVMLSVIILSVVMLNVTAPFRHKECRIGTSPTLIILYTKSFSAALHSTSQRAIYTSDFIVRFCCLVRLKHNLKYFYCGEELVWPDNFWKTLFNVLHHVTDPLYCCGITVIPNNNIA
jgi:hypothetical protein